MSLRIRLRQQGRTNRQTYRLVVTDIRCPRDGKYLEMVGWYNPFSEQNNCQVHADRIQYWIGQGAQISPNAEALIAKVAPHVIKEIRERHQEKRVKKAAKRRALNKAKSAPTAAKVAKPKKGAVETKDLKAAVKPKAPSVKNVQADA